MPDSLKHLKLQKYKYTIIYIYDKNYKVITELAITFQNKMILIKGTLKDADKVKKNSEKIRCNSISYNFMLR